MMIVLFWLLFTILVFVAARSRNRSGILWTVGSLFITPFFALLFILVLGSVKETV